MYLYSWWCRLLLWQKCPNIGRKLLYESGIWMLDVCVCGEKISSTNSSLFCWDSLFYLQKSARDDLATVETEYNDLKGRCWFKGVMHSLIGRRDKATLPCHAHKYILIYSSFSWNMDLLRDGLNIGFNFLTLQIPYVILSYLQLRPIRKCPAGKQKWKHWKSSWQHGVQCVTFLNNTRKQQGMVTTLLCIKHPWWDVCIHYIFYCWTFS